MTVSTPCCCQSAPVTLALRSTPAAAPRVTVIAGPTTAERHVTSVLLVTMVTPAAHVSPTDPAVSQKTKPCRENKNTEHNTSDTYIE